MPLLDVDDGAVSAGAAGGPLVALARVLRASRVQKLVPLLLLLTNAALLAGGTVSAASYTASVLFVFLVSALGMQLNVLTDAALDRSTKPKLFSWLTADPRAVRAIMWAEGLAGLGLLGVAGAAWTTEQGTGGPLVAALVTYALCFTLYSYNFLARGAEGPARLKVFWWGNALTVGLGYFSLWVAGFALGGLPVEGWPRWLAIAVVVCGVDYGVFLNECAGDAAAERAHGLRTLPALLGQRRTSTVALALLFSSAAALVLLLVAAGDAAGSPAIEGVRTAALLWHAGVQALSAVMTLALVRRGHTRWERLVDSSFWLSRVGALAILAGGMWLSR